MPTNFTTGKTFSYPKYSDTQATNNSHILTKQKKKNTLINLEKTIQYKLEVKLHPNMVKSTETEKFIIYVLTSPRPLALRHLSTNLNVC